MKATTVWSRLGASGLIVFAAACGRSPTGPAQSPSPSQTTVTIVDGWSRLPVAGAAVTADGTQALTDGAGKVQLPPGQSGCIVIDVKAMGFLDRRTCASSPAGQITLWPVATADEAEVTRHWVFFNDRIDAGYWSEPIAIALAPELAARADVAQVWKAAAAAVESVSGGRIRFQWMTSTPAEGLVLEAAALPLSCSVAPPWPYDVGGFCVKYDASAYYLDRLQVAPARLADSVTALRALLSAAGIKPHTMPGLMNATRPDSGLSDFERKTLGMLGLRPRTVTWPDQDQVQ